jgi:hypothetical protein
MVRRLFAAMLAIGLLGATASAIAQTPHKPFALSAQENAQLKDEIARMTSLNPKEIEVHSKNAVIRVVLVNTGYNDDAAKHREYLASAISALMARKEQSDARLKSAVSLHVEFVRRGRWSSKTVDTIEFRRQANGALARHTT